MSKYLEWKRKALLMGTGQWWLPSGMADTDCYAAYQFKYASGANDALRDLTGHGYNLTNTAGVAYNPGYGYTWSPHWYSSGNGLSNSSLQNQNVQAAVIRFENASGSDLWFSRVNMGFGVVKNYGDNVDHNVGGFYYWYDEGSNARRTVMVYQNPANNPASGVVGVNRSYGTQYTSDTNFQPYINGTTTGGKNIVAHWNDAGVAYTSWAYAVFGGGRGWNSENYQHGGFTIVAGAFYSRHLNAEEHAFVAEQLLAL